MHGPLYSTITFFAEIIISSIIYFVIYKGYRNNKFYTKLASFTLLYEILFNISYMVSRVPSQTKATKGEPAYLIGLAITHGVLSLVMFVALIIFFIIAWKKYKKGVNYFNEHKILTFTFLVFWTFSVVSGLLFYFLEYVK